MQRSATSLLARFSSRPARTSCSRRLSSLGNRRADGGPGWCSESNPRSAREPARHPDAAGSDLRQSAGQLLAGLGVGQDAFDALAKQRVAFGFLQIVADDQQARATIVIQNVAQQRAGGLARGMRVDHVHRSLGNFQIAQIRRQHGIQLFGCDLKSRVLKQATEIRPAPWGAAREGRPSVHLRFRSPYHRIRLAELARGARRKNGFHTRHGRHRLLLGRSGRGPCRNAKIWPEGALIPFRLLQFSVQNC